VGLRVSPDAVKKINISCLGLELNPDPSVVQPTLKSLYNLRYPGSTSDSGVAILSSTERNRILCVGQLAIRSTHFHIIVQF
jgi:hypothetical protein